MKILFQFPFKSPQTPFCNQAMILIYFMAGFFCPSFSFAKGSDSLNALCSQMLLRLGVVHTLELPWTIAYRPYSVEQIAALSQKPARNLHPDRVRSIIKREGSSTTLTFRESTSFTEISAPFGYPDIRDVARGKFPEIKNKIKEGLEPVEVFHPLIGVFTIPARESPYFLSSNDQMKIAKEWLDFDPKTPRLNYNINHCATYPFPGFESSFILKFLREQDELGKTLEIDEAQRIAILNPIAREHGIFYEEPILTGQQLNQAGTDLALYQHLCHLAQNTGLSVDAFLNFLSKRRIKIQRRLDYQSNPRWIKFKDYFAMNGITVTQVNQMTRLPTQLRYNHEFSHAFSHRLINFFKGLHEIDESFVYIFDVLFNNHARTHNYDDQERTFEGPDVGLRLDLISSGIPAIYPDFMGNCRILVQPSTGAILDIRCFDL